MDSVRYWLALGALMTVPGGLLYWFSVHPFVRFWRSLGARVAVALHIVMIAALAYGAYLLRGHLAGGGLRREPAADGDLRARPDRCPRVKAGAGAALEARNPDGDAGTDGG